MAEVDDWLSQELDGVKPLKNTSNKVKNMPVDVMSGTSIEARRKAAVTNSHELTPNRLNVEFVPAVEPHDVIQYKENGVQEGIYRKVRLAKYPIETRLDLHGLTVKDASEKVFQFISDAKKCEMRMLLICHGKGEMRAEPAKLKSYVAEWLKEMPEVLAYHSAQKQHGGVGAVYVLLRKSVSKKKNERLHYS